MPPEEILDRLAKSLADLDSGAVIQTCKDALAQGIPALTIISQGLAKGMDVVGQRYESKEYYLSELMMAGEVMREGLEVLKPYLGDEQSQRTKTVVIGVVEGDLHDIGKNIVVMLLNAAGFKIVDLGTDVTSAAFVEAVRTHRPNIVAMSALLTVTMPKMEEIVKALETEDLRKGVKVIIGGAPVTSDFARTIHVDYAAENAVDGVNMCKTWTE